MLESVAVFAARAGINNVTRHYEEVIAGLQVKLMRCGIHPDEELTDADYEDIRNRLGRLEVLDIQPPSISHCEECNRPMITPSWVGDPDYEGSWIYCQVCIDASGAGQEDTE